MPSGLDGFTRLCINRKFSPLKTEHKVAYQNTTFLLSMVQKRVPLQFEVVRTFPVFFLCLHYSSRTALVNKSRLPSIDASFLGIPGN